MNDIKQVVGIAFIENNKLLIVQSHKVLRLILILLLVVE